MLNMSDTTTLCRFQCFYVVYESTFWTENLIVSGYKYTEIKGFQSYICWVVPCKQMVYTLIHTFNELWCLKVSLFFCWQNFAFRLSWHKHYTKRPMIPRNIFLVINHGKKEIGRCDHYLRETYNEICEISMNRVFL